MVDGAVWAFEGVAPHADVRGEAVIAPGSIDSMLLVEGKLHDFAAGFAAEKASLSPRLSPRLSRGRSDAFDQCRRPAAIAARFHGPWNAFASGL